MDQVKIDDAVYRKCQNHGITKIDFRNVRDKYEKYVAGRYSDFEYSKEWLQWKVQSKVWEEFFPKEQFPFHHPRPNSSRIPGPIKEPPAMYRSFASYYPVDTETQQRTTMSTLPHPAEALLSPSFKTVKSLPSAQQSTFPDRGYKTMEQVMERMAVEKGGLILRKRFFQYLQRMRDLSRARHKECASDYRHYMADRSTWLHFFKDKKFPGIEPEVDHRCGLHPSEYLHNPSMNLSIPRTTSFKKTSPQPNNRILNPVSEISHILLNGTVITITKEILASINDSFTKDMELRKTVEKALGCQFSLFILNQESMIRGVKVLPFDLFASPKEISDIIRKGYRFLNAWIEKIYTILMGNNMLRLSIYDYYKQWKDSLESCTLLVDGAYQKKFNCSEEQMKDLIYNLMADEMTSFENDFHCKLITRSHEGGSGLVVVLRPAINDLLPVTYNMATNIFLKWVERSLQRPLKFSIFWKLWRQAHFPMFVAPVDPYVASYMSPDSTASCSNTSSELCSAIPLADPEAEWELHAKFFPTDDTGRTCVEKKARAESSLRIVLDQQTGDLVTLGEFELRTRLRERTNSKKRKAEFDHEREIGSKVDMQTQKRNCTRAV